MAHPRLRSHWCSGSYAACHVDLCRIGRAAILDLNPVVGVGVALLNGVLVGLAPHLLSLSVSLLNLSDHRLLEKLLLLELLLLVRSSERGCHLRFQGRKRSASAVVVDRRVDDREVVRVVAS